MKNNNVSILIVTHNHKEFIVKTLDSLIQFNYSNVYICDANSVDGTKEILENSPFRKNTLFKNKLESFSKNNNDLIRIFNLDTKYYLLLNPDLYFTEDFIQKLYFKSESDEKIAISTPTIYYPHGQLQVTWKKFPNVLQVIKKRIGFLTALQEIQMEKEEIDWCLGACMLVSKVLLKKNKSLLDERYRLYCEDIDICFEAKMKKLKVVGVKEASAFHYLNELSSKSFFSKYNYWNITSIIKFIFKWNFKYINH